MPEAVESEDCRGRDLRLRPNSESIALSGGGGGRGGERSKCQTALTVERTWLFPPSRVLPARFGQFGGQFVPESLFDCLVELEEAHKSAMADPKFWKEFHGLYGYMNRPSNLYKAERLTEHAGGATIWLKREDLYVFQSVLSALEG